MESRSLLSLDDLPGAIKKAHNAVILQAKRSIHSAYECGLLLAQAKDQCGHGSFASWLSENVEGLSDSTVRLYMRIADGENWPRIKEKIKLGEIVTIREAQQICKREPKPEPELQLNDSETQDSSPHDVESKRQHVADLKVNDPDDRQDEHVDPVSEEVPASRLNALKVELEQKVWTWIQRKPAYVWHCAASWLESIAEEIRKS